MNKTMCGIISRAKSSIKRITKSASSAIIHNIDLSRRTLIIAPLALLVSVVTILGISVSTSYAYAVSYQGETIGYVSSEEVYTEVMENITEKTDNVAVKSLSNMEVQEEVAAGERMLDAEELTKAIVKNVDEVEENYGIFKDGVLYASCYTEKQIENAVNKYVSENSKGLSDAKLAGDYIVKKGVYSTETLMNSEMLYNKLCNEKAKVCGYKIETRTEKIKYTTKTKKSDKYAKGEKVTVREGKNGARKVTEKVYYEGKKVSSREVVEAEVIKKAVSKKIIKGTGSLSLKAKMSFPLKESSGYYISSYYGAPRYGYYHQGVDIIAGYGTPIYATAGGTVIEAGYSNGGWGYTVVIDHGNGIKTRYAHCSSINVAAGETVNRGDQIAAVGSTGNSECNHLHLEAIVNGTRVNPMNYFN